MPPMQTYLTSMYSSIPYLEPSRPIPDCLTPPKGATSVVIKPVFTPTIPYSSASATRQTRPMSREEKYDASPNSVRLASWMTSACDVKRNNGATGPEDPYANT